MVTTITSQSVHAAAGSPDDRDTGASADHVPTPPRTTGRASPGVGACVSAGVGAGPGVEDAGIGAGAWPPASSLGAGGASEVVHPMTTATSAAMTEPATCQLRWVCLVTPSFDFIGEPALAKIDRITGLQRHGL